MTMFCEYRKTARRGKGENGSIAGNERIFWVWESTCESGILVCIWSWMVQGIIGCISTEYSWVCNLVPIVKNSVVGYMYRKYMILFTIIQITYAIIGNFQLDSKFRYILLRTVLWGGGRSLTGSWIQVTKVIQIISNAVRPFGILPFLPEKSNLSLVTKESLIFQKITRVQDLSLLKKGRTLLSERTLRYDQVRPIRNLPLLWPISNHSCLKFCHSL